MLGVVVTDTLFRTHPDLSEGRLAKLRAAVVNARALAQVARDDRARHAHQLGRGEEATGGRDKSSILSDTVEALIGAIYLSGGFEASGAVVHLLFDPLMDDAARLGAGLDWKTSLQELSADHSPRRARVRHPGRRPRPREDLHRAGARRRAAATGTAPAGPRRRPSSRRPRPPTRRSSQSRTATSTGDAEPPVPELPEVEVVRRGLEAHVVGRTLDPGGRAAPATGAPAPRRREDFAAALTGRRVLARRRRGKYLWLRSTAATRCSATSG